ncbi:MAG: hypothetical protein ACKV19_02935 [Verrucomicrobiales bacterium]
MIPGPSRRCLRRPIAGTVANALGWLADSGSIVAAAADGLTAEPPRFNRDIRLTDVHGHVVREVLA